jgi:hypothetical protein
MRYHLYPNDNILRSPNLVLIIDLRTGSYQFMVSGEYIPDEESKIEEQAFRLLPNTAIEYMYLLNDQDIVYHFELNSIKLDNRKYLLKNSKCVH